MDFHSDTLMLRVHVLNSWALGVLGTSNCSIGFGKVYEYQVLGPLGLQIYAEEAESLLGCQGCIHTLPFRHPQKLSWPKQNGGFATKGCPFL